MERLTGHPTKLIKQKNTPNISRIEGSGRMYGQLSEIAHSAKPETYLLLGYSDLEDGNTGINIFGTYDENIKVTLGIHIDIFCRFFAEMIQFQEEHVDGYKCDDDMYWMKNVFIPLGRKSGIEYFERF